ncbi:unnamed protein product, partial [Closterium sp. NIES-53]
SCASGLPDAGAVLLELELLLELLGLAVLLRLLELVLLELLELLVLELLQVLGLEFVLLEVLLELLAVLELPVLLELVLLELLELLVRELLRVLALVVLLTLVRLRVLELALLETEVLLALVLPLGVLVVSLLVLETLRGPGRTSSRSLSRFLPVSPLPTPSPYTGPTGGLAERREPASRLASPVRAARTSGRAPRQRPPAVPRTHQMALRPSTASQRVPLPSPPASSLPVLANPESDSLRASSPTVARLLSTIVTDPSLESAAASALVAEVVDFAACCRLDNAAGLVTESASVCPPSVGGEYALSTDVLEDRQEEF